MRKKYNIVDGLMIIVLAAALFFASQFFMYSERTGETLFPLPSDAKGLTILPTLEPHKYKCNDTTVRKYFYIDQIRFQQTVKPYHKSIIIKYKN